MSEEEIEELQRGGSIRVTKAHLRDVLIDLLRNDESVQYAVKEALEEQKRRDDWEEAKAWT